MRPADLSATVELANATVEASGRRVDWIHIPVLPDVGEAFFAPLKNLKPKGARVYLGVVHHMDGFKERIAHARKFLPDFGVAGYCGFGRVPPARIAGRAERASAGDRGRALDSAQGEIGMRIGLKAVLLTAAALGASASLATAQGFPDRPVK